MLHADHSNYELIKEMLPRLWAHVWRLTYDVELAEQLVHSACTFILEQGLPLPSDKSPRLWLFWSFYRALRRVRGHDRLGRKSCDIKAQAIPKTGLEDMATATLDVRIVNAIRQLPNEQREIFLLANIEFFSVSEVSFIMGITVREVINALATTHLNMSRTILNQIDIK